MGERPSIYRLRKIRRFVLRIHYARCSQCRYERILDRCIRYYPRGEKSPAACRGTARIRHPRYTAINSFKAELFPRLTQPDYSTARDDDEIRYITWLTATADILKQKSDGYVGKKYEVTVETIPVLDEKNPLIIKRKFKVIMTKRLNSRLKHD